MFEKNGGDDGTRTRGLCRDSEKLISIFNDFESTDGNASHWKYVVSKANVYHDVYHELSLHDATISENEMTELSACCTPCRLAAWDSNKQ